MANQILLMYYQHHYLFELIQQQFSSYCSIDVGVQSSEYSRAPSTAELQPQFLTPSLTPSSPSTSF